MDDEKNFLYLSFFRLCLSKIGSHSPHLLCRDQVTDKSRAILSYLMMMRMSMATPYVEPVVQITMAMSFGLDVISVKGGSMENV